MHYVPEYLIVQKYQFFSYFPGLNNFYTFSLIELKLTSEPDTRKSPWGPRIQPPNHSGIFIRLFQTTQIKLYFRQNCIFVKKMNLFLQLTGM